ncbi:MAG TPA: glycine cleavage system aminomethyltransferase GcvT [Egibacteraceae bacterium]|nr:glycine cleavage system aminomethyltransferase GcvT [Egibacteraceae bacterium]
MQTTDESLRRSPIDDRHRALGATMTGFGGWEMPLDYGSVVAEHTAVREACGVFDLSHLGTLRVTGADAAECVRRSFTNDPERLDVGRAHYTLCLNRDGGIIDDLLVYRLAWGFFVVPNAANSRAVQDVVESAAAELEDCSVADVKADLACLAVQGPGAEEIVTAAGVDVSGMSYLDCGPLPLASAGPDAAGGVSDGPPPQSGVMARSGYTGEHGYELFALAEQAPTLWDRLVAAGAAPVGLGARDTLRLEMGYPLHGNDISPGTSPVEARLTWAVKGIGFQGEEAYLRAKEAGPSRRLWGLRAVGRGIPRAHCPVLRDGVPVGDMTSGTFSPTLRVGIGMGYLDSSVEQGDAVEIDVRGKLLPAEVVRPPFVDSDPKG